MTQTHQTRLKHFFVSGIAPSPDFVKYVNEYNFGLAYADKEEALKTFRSYTHTFNDVLNFEQDPETKYWHLLKGNIESTNEVVNNV